MSFLSKLTFLAFYGFRSIKSFIVSEGLVTELIINIIIIALFVLLVV